jgi:hypothetical protein
MRINEYLQLGAEAGVLSPVSVVCAGVCARDLALDALPPHCNGMAVPQGHAARTCHGCETLDGPL